MGEDMRAFDPQRHRRLEQEQALECRNLVDGIDIEDHKDTNQKRGSTSEELQELREGLLFRNLYQASLTRARLYRDAWGWS